MEKQHSRRSFLRNTAIAGMALSISATEYREIYANNKPSSGKRVGIIGLDTSHSISFAKSLNDVNSRDTFHGYKVVAAYPYGSRNIESSTRRIPGYTEDIRKMGICIVNSIEELLGMVDVVMLETNDGHPHLEQATQVLKAGKRLFVDKPVAGTLNDVKQIFRLSELYQVPVFSASSLRYLKKAQEVAAGTAGRVVGADTFSPATLEKSHPDLFWYGIHGVELLYTIMGTGCKTVSRIYTEETDIVVGTGPDGRIGTFRGTRSGPHHYGGTVFTEKNSFPLGSYEGYTPLLKEITNFFKTGTAPVSLAETLEIYAFMQAADESKKNGGQAVLIESVLQEKK